MSTITGSLLDIDISKIYKEVNKKIIPSYRCILHTTNEDIAITILESIEILAEFNTNITDFHVINFNMGSGDFVKEIHPNRDNLEISIIKEFDNKNIPDEINTYKLIILNNTGSINSGHYLVKDREYLNSTEQMHVEAQCVMKEVEGMRAVMVDGIYRSTNVRDLIINVMRQGTRRVNGKSGNTNNLKINGTAVDIRVSISPPNNTMNYNHIEVPTGVNVLDLPTFIQNTSYGVYNGGIGTYLRRYGSFNYIFVYPQYSANLFDECDKKLIVYAVNNARLDFIENTYTVDGDVVKIIANSNLKIIDDGDNPGIDSGTALINSDPNMVLKRNAEITNTSISVSKENQITGSKHNDRRDYVNKSKYLNNEANLYKHRTRILKDTMAQYQIQWNFCDTTLLYPGMPVMYVYEDPVKKDIVELKGTIMSTYSRYNVLTTTESAIVNLLVEKPMHQNI